ncbi:MAG: Chromosome partitioning protein ParA [Candidatus Heimdallarchaeota archaeon LC_3]|nr:MAG: Chromosome partitioning protein ParA [Candidatus Heimdallarchaeota archaeon LC_3]
MKIVATHSFRGGSGKTFIALNIAAASARAGFKTIVMDCDFVSPSFQSNIQVKSSQKNSGNDFLLGKCKETEVISQTTIPNLNVIFGDPKPVLGQGLLEPVEETHWKALQRFSQLRESLEKQGYQRFILDTSPNLSYNSASALTVADSIVLVHRPVIHSLDLAIYILQTIYTTLKKSLKPRSFYLIFNQVPHGSPEEVKKLLENLTIEIQKHIEIKVLDSIPLDLEMDFWNSLLILEDSQTHNKIINMTKKIF